MSKMVSVEKIEAIIKTLEERADKCDAQYDINKDEFWLGKSVAFGEASQYLLDLLTEEKSRAEEVP